MKFIIIKETIKLFVMLMGPIIAIPSIVMCCEFNIMKFGKYLIFGDEFENISKKLDCLGDKINDIEDKMDSNNNSILTVENAIYVTCGIVTIGVIIFIGYISMNGGADSGSIQNGFETLKDEIGKTSSNVIVDNHKNMGEVINLTKAVNENISLSSQRSDEILQCNVATLASINDNMSQIMGVVERSEKLITERIIPKLISLLNTPIVDSVINNTVNEGNNVISSVSHENSMVSSVNHENSMSSSIESEDYQDSITSPTNHESVRIGNNITTQRTIITDWDWKN